MNKSPDCTSAPERRPKHEVHTNGKPPTMTGKSDARHRTGTFAPRRCTPSELKNIPNTLALQTWATQNSLAPVMAAYINCGAEDEESALANRQGFSKYALRPRVLKDVENVQTETTILQGRVKVGFPVGIAPFAGCRAVHPDGERVIAAAAAKAGVIYTIPNWAGTPLSIILQEHQKVSKNASMSDAPLFFQIYPNKARTSSEGIDRDHIKALLNFLSQSSAGRIVAVVITCDTVNSGNREKTYKNSQWISDLDEQVGGFPTPCALKEATNLPPVIEEGFSEKMSWEDIRWVKHECEKLNLALILKGIMTYEDALLAAKAGVNAIVVSNHGGRQLDGTLGTVEVVEECVLAVRHSSTEVFVDGGIRRGKDVVKCLALGAKYVFVGRPILWGLAAGGQEGVGRALEILKEEVETVFQLIGCKSLRDLSRWHVQRKGENMDGRPVDLSTIKFISLAGGLSIVAFALGRWVQGRKS